MSTLNSLRRHILTVNTPAGGAAASAVTITGTIRPVGSPVEVAFGPHPVNVPAAGWTAATTVAGGWSLATTRPAAGTWYVHARSARYPRCDVHSAAVVVA